MQCHRLHLAFVFLLSLTCWPVIHVSPLHAQSVTDTASVVQIDAWYGMDKLGRTEIHVTAKVREGFHIYATTQPKPFIAAEIQLTDSSATLKGPPLAAPSPTTRFHEQLRYELHEHAGQVEWSIPLTWSPSIAIPSRALKGTIKLQACEENRCLAPSTIEFTAELKRTHPATAVEPSETVLPPSTVEPEIAAQNTEVVGGAESALLTDSAPTPATLTTASLQPRSLSGTVSDASQTPAWIALPFAFLGGLLLNLMVTYGSRSCTSRADA